VSAASLYFDLGRLKDAEAHARMAMAAHPSFAHGMLAQIALHRDRVDEAEREARAAMEDQSLRIGPMVTLAEVLHAKKEDRQALDMVRKAEEAYGQREAKDPDLIRGLHLVRGKILADQGDAAAAEASFKKEIELFPDSVRGYSSLAILYALTGRTAEVRATLKQMVDVNPTPLAYAEAVKTLRILNDTRSATSLLRYALGRFPGDPALRNLTAGG
jgi:tetratricopeptide (TPR) repeat protein